MRFLLSLIVAIELLPRPASAVSNEVKECALQAEKQFKSLGYVDATGTSYQSHYNKRLDKCLMLIDTSLPNRTITLIDAYEGRPYAEYFGTMVKWELQTVYCWISLAELDNGTPEDRRLNQKTICKSIDEWDSLTDVFMRE
jgi:hypothetical protein